MSEDDDEIDGCPECGAGGLSYETIWRMKDGTLRSNSVDPLPEPDEIEDIHQIFCHKCGFTE